MADDDEIQAGFEEAMNILRAQVGHDSSDDATIVLARHGEEPLATTKGAFRLAAQDVRAEKTGVNEEMTFEEARDYMDSIGMIQHPDLNVMDLTREEVGRGKAQDIPATFRHLDDGDWEVETPMTNRPIHVPRSVAEGQWAVSRSPGDWEGDRIMPVRAVATPEIRIEMLRTALSLADPERNPFNGVNPDYSAESMMWCADTMHDADLYWVSAQMTDLLQHAYPEMPAATLTYDLLPSETGIVFFEVPILGKDARTPGGTVSVQAMAWGPSQFDVDEKIRHDGARAADDTDPHISMRYRFTGNGISITTWRKYRQWMPLGRTDWPYGQDTEADFAPPEADQTQLDSIIEDRRLLAAFCLLSQQDNVTDITDMPIPKPVRKRLERRRMRVPAKVKLIDIHKPRHVSREGTREVEWTHRWWVRGHWKQVAYGPKRSLRRPQYIQPFVKGPDDKPLADPATIVRVWRDDRR